MTKENKIVALSTTVAMTLSVLAVLVGSGIGWGMLQTKVSTLEARASAINSQVLEYHSRQLDKELYYKDMERMHQDIKEIRADLKTLIRNTRRTNR